MANIPRRNLAPSSEPWGRSVDQRLGKLDGAVDLLAQGNKNSFKGINTSVSAINRALQEVQATQQSLLDQQSQLADQQSQLASQQAALQRTLDRQFNHQLGTDSGNIATITTSYAKKRSVFKRVPAHHNYCWMVITATGLFQADRYDGGTLQFRTHVISNGTDLGYWQDVYNMTDNPYFTATISHQHGFHVSPGTNVGAEIAVSKSISSTGFYNKSLRLEVSIGTYGR